MSAAATAIYTSVFGGFEKVWPPLRQDSSTERILVTDCSASAGGWDVRHVDPGAFSSARLANRNQKMLFYLRLPSAGVSVYVDANVRPVASLAPLFDAFLSSGAGLGMYRHYARGSVRQEAEACIARRKVENPASVEDELALYQAEGFPDKAGMWEGSVIFKRHNSPGLSSAMEEWWELYSRFETRDQFSLPFIIWKHGLKVFDLDNHSPGREHYFVRLQHSSSGVANRSARYLQARAPENPVWASLHKLLSTLVRRAQARKKL